MTEMHRLFQPGDEVLVTLVGVVTDVTTDPGDDEPYEVELKRRDGSGIDTAWLREEDIVGTPEYVAEAPIVPGDKVYLKGYKGRIGEVIALRKGHATIDWEPDDPEAFATSTHPIPLLLRPEPKS